MKRYLMSIIIAILILTPVLLAGCTQETELENRIANLETRLTATESTIRVLQGRIDQLEKESLTEVDILTALRGKEFWASIGPLPGFAGWGNFRVIIEVE